MTGLAVVPEEAGWLGPCAYHTSLPADPGPISALLVPPLLSAAARDHRRRVVLARSLAAAGITATRFDYRGTANSGGTPAETIHDLVQDTERFVGRTAGSGGPGPVLIGIHAGALVAAEVARRSDTPVRLVLWDPPVDGATWVHQLLRAAAFAAMAAEDRTGDADQLRTRLATGDDVDVMGYRLRANLAASIGSARLQQEPSAPGGAIRVLETRPSLAPDQVVAGGARKRRSPWSLAFTTVGERRDWLFDSTNFQNAEEVAGDDRAAAATVAAVRSVVADRRATR